MRQQLYAAAWAGYLEQSSIAGEEVSAESLGQRDVGRIVDREVLPKLPAPCEQGSMRCALQRKLAQVGQRELSPSRIERPCECLSAQDGSDLEIEQFRRGESFPS